MKNILVFILLGFLIRTNSFCQSLPDSSATWTIASVSMGSYFANETFVIKGDTTINSTIYKSIFVTKDSIYNPLISNYFCAVREFTNKWYFIPADSTKEFMLYDFGVKTGDTVTINNPWVEGKMKLNVFDIDSIELNGSYYKNIELGFYLNPYDPPYISDHWIRGIGSTQGLYLSGSRTMDGGFQLLCFHRNDTLIYLNSPDGSCGYLFNGVKTNSLVSEVKLSPNPVFDKLSITSINDILAEIYDNSGKKVISSNSKQIDVSHLVKGIYIVKIFDTKKEFIKSEKIIKR